MCDCLMMSFIPWGKLWRRVLLRLCFSFSSFPLIYPAIEIELPVDGMLDSPHASGSLEEKNSPTIMYREVKAKRAVYVLKSKSPEKRNGESSTNTAKEKNLTKVQRRYASNGGSDKVCLYTKQGRKGVNQDAMLVWEEFASEEDMIFCGVFDGHGVDGHRVARNVRDVLPEKLASIWKSQQKAAKDSSAFSSDDSETEGFSIEESGYLTDTAWDPSLITAWKESFVAAYKLMDRELLINDHVDCVSSGTTAVSLVKQGNDLIVGNVGDSRAVLGTRANDDSLLALQLTVDLKPNEPREFERIKRHKGRVFALQNEPLVHRVWLPHQNAPGLAMARALGDYCLKNHGVISEPEVTYRRLTKKDEFVVLATDGVWDALTNEQVVEIVASSPEKSLAARRVVESAVHAWKFKHIHAKVDDCAAVCLFL